MPQIVLTDEQARVLADATETVELRNPEGHLIARLTVPFEDEIAEARRRLASSQPRWSSAQVQGLLSRLQEIRDAEGMDEAKLRDLLGKFRSGASL
jgi:hypothetical protein